MRKTGVFVVGIAAGWIGFAAPALASPQQAGVQVALRAGGLYHGPIDGIAGPLTRAAVTAAQVRAHLPETGAVTTRTRDSLGPLGKPLLGKRQIAPGNFGLDVSSLQFLLARVGFYHGALDGFMGPKTVAAVETFQGRAGLGVDGIAGPLTLKRLVASFRRHRPPMTETYIVQTGDTLTAIAAHFEVTLTDLANLNHLDLSKVLLSGTRLTVPVSAAHASLTASPEEVRSQLDVWAAKLGVSEHLVRAIAWMESGYQPNVVSSVGAQGVLQVMPATRDFVEQVLVGHPLPHTLDGDIETGVLELRHLLSEFDGDTTLAVAAWYQGDHAVREYGLYEMTKPYVRDVLALQARM